MAVELRSAIFCESFEDWELCWPRSFASKWRTGQSGSSGSILIGHFLESEMPQHNEKSETITIAMERTPVAMSSAVPRVLPSIVLNAKHVAELDELRPITTADGIDQSKQWISSA